MFKKPAIAVLDLETVGKYQDAVVCTLGLTLLDTQDIKTLSEILDIKKAMDYALANTLYLKLNVSSQRELGRSVDKKVLSEFWLNQPQDIRDAALKPSADDISLKDMFVKIEEFIRSKNLLWSDVAFTDRMFFDLSKLEHIHQVTLGNQERVPWNTREYVELSQFFTLMIDCRYGGIQPKELDPEVFKYHMSNYDAALDMVRLSRVIGSAI